MTRFFHFIFLVAIAQGLLTWHDQLTMLGSVRSIYLAIKKQILWNSKSMNQTAIMQVKCVDIYLFFVFFLHEIMSKKILFNPFIHFVWHLRNQNGNMKQVLKIIRAPNSILGIKATKPKWKNPHLFLSTVCLSIVQCFLFTNYVRERKIISVCFKVISLRIVYWKVVFNFLLIFHFVHSLCFSSDDFFFFMLCAHIECVISKLKHKIQTRTKKKQSQNSEICLKVE